jgi:hypothetical protein
MAVYLSPIGGAGWQFFDNSGNPLTGGRLYTYAAGTTTPQTTYTTFAGNVAHTNPIVLDSAGRIPSGGEVWLTQNISYKFVLRTSADVLIATYDNISAVALPIDSSDIIYDAPFTGSVITTVENKLSQTVSVKDFGAVGDGVTNDTDAFAAASAYISSQDGGTLIIPPGVYIVGKQTFAGQFGLGYAYSPSPIIEISNCTQPVVIQGNGAVLRLVNGLKYGSFNPVTGAVFNPPPFPPAFLNPDYKAEAGFFINIVSCRSVTITDLELDGNINNQIIGGEWGGPGRQLANGGLRDEQNENVLVQNFYAHHHGLDGIMSKYTVTSTTADAYPHTFVNCRLNYNGRQGMSWIGGNNITMISCDMSHTGKNGVVYTEPGAGLDIEPESSLGFNGTFINCRFYDNAGVGMIASAGPSSDCNFYGCQMIGTTNYSGWVQYPRFSFHDCTIVGSWIWPGGDATNPEDASKWYGCKFYMDPAKSPSGVIYGTRMEFIPSENIVFQSCTFYAASGYTLPFSDGGVDGTVYNNCTFEQVGAGTFFTRGNFYGYNLITHSGTWGGATASTVFGRLYVNGVEQSLTMPSVLSLPMLSNDGFAGKIIRVVSHFDPLVWAAGVGGAIQGDIVLSPTPTAGSYVGSVCVTAGNPGTWKLFGEIQP